MSSPKNNSNGQSKQTHSNNNNPVAAVVNISFSSSSPRRSRSSSQLDRFLYSSSSATSYTTKNNDNNTNNVHHPSSSWSSTSAPPAAAPAAAPASASVSLSGMPSASSAWAHSFVNNHHHHNDDNDFDDARRNPLHRVSTEPISNKTSDAAAAARRRGKQQQPHLSQQDSQHTGDSWVKNAAAQQGAKDDAKQQQHKEPHPSLSDRIAATALAGTLEFLKLAGGVTLSTTGKLVAPPLYVTRTILLPALWNASLDVLDTNTPDRVKDWFRIVTSSVHHFVSVLKHTTTGQHFRTRWLIVLQDLLHVITSDTTRQVIMDGTATIVKFAELLDTNEFYAYTQQAAVWACRFLQAASQPQNQLLIHNLVQALQSGSQLLADPHTTVALAEVTAYLCHALEMQQEHESILLIASAGGDVDARQQGTSHDNADADRSKMTKQQQQQQQQQQQRKQKRAIRRRERDRYQTQTNIHRKTVQDPTATVEQIILSSLGVVGTAFDDNDSNDEDSDVQSDDSADDDDGDDNNDYDDVSVPRRIVCGKRSDDDGGEQDENVKTTTTAAGTAGGIEWDTTAPSIRQQVDSAQNDCTQEDFHVKARDDIDVAYLRQQIYARAAVMEQVREQATTARQQQEQEQQQQQRERRQQVGVSTSSQKQQNDNDLEDPNIPKQVTTTRTTSQQKRPPADKTTLRPKIQVEEEEEEEASIDDKKAATRKKKDHPFRRSPLDDRIDHLPGPTDGTRHEGETPVEHFYRVLNEILENQRDKSFQGTASTTATIGDDSLRPLLPRGRVTLRDGKPAKLSDLVRERLAAAGVTVDQEQKQIQISRPPNKRLVLMTLTVLLALGVFWFGLGCYGMYVMLYPSRQIPGKEPLSGPGKLTRTDGGVASNEIVIRVVREVVHVDAEGNYVNRKAEDESEDSAMKVEEIAECVAKHVK